MNKIVLGILFLLLLPICGAAQKSTSQLLPAHDVALQQFLLGHTDLEFLSSKNYDHGTLRDLRKHFGARFMPYYRRGDFNHDGRQDFAVVLKKKVSPKEYPDLAETHRFRYEVTVVIFNGYRGGKYKAAYINDTSAPLVCFLGMSRGKRGKLYFQVPETEEGFVMTPAGQGYR